jgi:hypothetical protein
LLRSPRQCRRHGLLVKPQNIRRTARNVIAAPALRFANDPTATAMELRDNNFRSLSDHQVSRCVAD